MKRKDPTQHQITAAAIAQLFNIPRPDLEHLTVKQILSMVHIDHDPVPWSIARDLGWQPDQYNHPRNLTLRLIPNHRIKTAKTDIPAIAKGKRISKSQAEFRQRLLAKSGQAEIAEPTRKPRTKLKSRGFQKPPENTKHDWKLGRRVKT